MINFRLPWALTVSIHLSKLLHKRHDSHDSVPATLTLALVLRLVLEAEYAGGLTSEDQSDQETADDYCIHDGNCNRDNPVVTS